MERLKQLGLTKRFVLHLHSNLDPDSRWHLVPCYRSKEAQGHWKEYDVTTTYNPPDIQKVRMDLERRVPKNRLQRKERESNGTRSHDRNTTNIY